MAETTTNRRAGPAWGGWAIRSYMSGRLTQAPPNFATFAGLPKVPSPMGQLGVQHAPSRPAADRVVREDDEPQVPGRHADPADGRGHATGPRRIAGHRIEQGLRPVRLPPGEGGGPLGGGARPPR